MFRLRLLLLITFLFANVLLLPAQSWKKTQLLIKKWIDKNETLKAANEISKTEKRLSKFSKIEQFEFYTLASIFYKNSEDFVNALQIVKKQSELVFTSFSSDKQKEFEVDYRYLDVLRNTENIKLSKYWYESNIARMLDSHGESSIQMAWLFISFAAILSENGDFERAFTLVNKVSVILEMNSNDDPQLKLGNLWKKIGYIYYNSSDFENAIKYYQIALIHLTKEEGNYSSSVATLLSFLGEAYHDAGQGDLSLEYSLKALKIVEEKKVDLLHLHYYCNAVGSAYFLKKDYDNAVKYYKRAAALSLGYAWTNLARTYNIQEKFELAHAALDSSNFLFNYTKRNNFAAISYPSVFMNVLDLRSEVYDAQYMKTRDITYLKKSEETHMETNQLCLFNIKSFDKNFNKNIYYNQAIKYNNKAIDISYDLFLKSNDSIYLEKVFYYSEINKSLLLLGNIISNKTLQLADVPLELETEEAILRQEITRKEKEIYEQKKQEKSDHLLFTLRQRYYVIKDSINIYCKDFDKNEYFIDENNSKSFRNSLDTNTTLLSYSIVGNHLYSIVVNKESLHVVQQSIDTNFEKSIRQLTQMVSKIDENEYQTNAVFINTASHELYKKLIEPIQDQLHHKIIVITNGILDYLPFDILISTPTHASLRFHLLPFLIKKHVISYDYSAHLWKENLTSKEIQAAEGMLCTAPFGSNITNDSLDTNYLPSSTEEVQQISTIMNGKVLLNQQANKSTILANIGNYRFLHFATHGKSNDTKGEYSHVVFRGIKDNVLELLYAKEIYNVKLKAEMVVLSACESGIGEAQQGEGLISISRAFTYSGAKSVLTTLWSVNDNTTKDLMVSFYQNLQLGLTKDEALRKTKLQYLAQNKNQKAHPFYWSGFKIVGNCRAIR